MSDGTAGGHAPSARASGEAAFRPFRSVPLLLVILHALVLASFAHVVASPGNAGLGALLALAVGMVVVLACEADAHGRGAPLSHGMSYVMLLTWPLAVPAYLIETRRWRGLFWTAIWAATLLASALTGAFAMALVRAIAAALR